MSRVDACGRSQTLHPVICKQGVVGSSPIVSTAYVLVSALN
jgi:hypothetical protein